MASSAASARRTVDKSTSMRKGKEVAGRIGEGGKGGRGGGDLAVEQPRFVPQLPYELLLIILGFAARCADDSSRPLSFLLLNKRISQDLHPHIYRRITLSSYASLDSFSSLLLNQPHLRKHVKALWIGPRSLNSDLLRALAPDDVQLHHERSAWSLVLRRTHNILRSCRNIQNLALSGKLISVDHAKSYGKACAPREVWGINPYSFVCAYTADILEKTEIFQLYDLTLAQEECSSIVQMRKLRHFIWTTPSLSSTSTFSTASAAAGAGVRYHPPREAALLWRLLLLSNPNTHNRKTRPPLRATFMAGSDLVAEVEGCLCPIRLPAPVKAVKVKTTNGHHNHGKSLRPKRDNSAVGHAKDGNGSANGDTISTRASLGGHSSSDGESLVAAGSEVSDSEEDEEDEDDSDGHSDRPPYASSSSQHHHHHHHTHNNGNLSPLLHPSSSSSAFTRAEALEASLRSLSFNDVPPPLFLYQPSPSLSSGGHSHSNGHGNGYGNSQTHGQGRFDGLPEGGQSANGHGGQGPAPAQDAVDLNNDGDGVQEVVELVDPDAALNALSYDPPPLQHTQQHNHHQSQNRRLVPRAPSLSSLTSTRASTHGHSSHNHASLQQQQQQQHRPTLDDIDAPNRLRTRIVPRQMVLEWEALRDRVCPVNPPISPLAGLNPYIGYGIGGTIAGGTVVGDGVGGVGGDEESEAEAVDPGNALLRIWQLWIEATDI
ncbi:hypothetical protein CF326_g5828 [Tilletia indica]|nr:hypothetical protein CF326_g5828 [Tilletia indica]